MRPSRVGFVGVGELGDNVSESLLDVRSNSIRVCFSVNCWSLVVLMGCVLSGWILSSLLVKS